MSKLNDVGEVLAGQALPPGYGSVNPFVAVRGPDGAPGFIRFAQLVLGARETLAAHTLDADDLLIHAELRIGDSTVMLCDSKPHWAFTPALLQVYVSDASAVVERARASGAVVITEPTDFHGQQRLARFQDPWHNIWWLFEHGPRASRRAKVPTSYLDSGPTRRHRPATSTAPSTRPCPPCDHREKDG